MVGSVLIITVGMNPSAHCIIMADSEFVSENPLNYSTVNLDQHRSTDQFARPE